LFSIVLYFAHLQAVFIPIYFGIKSINKFKFIFNFYLIPYGFIFLGFASLFEMFDHFTTAWIYINHSSIFNWLFYSCLSIGLTLLSVSVLKKKIFIIFCCSLCVLSICAYWSYGKTIAILFQILISIFLIINWQQKFKDFLFWAYPIFGIFLTTFFGTNLLSTGNQIWHIFIGPSGSVSVLTFYLVLVRSGKRLSSIKL